MKKTYPQKTTQNAQNNDAKKAIGIFDSGLGGLTILRQVHKILPKENLIYFGDTAHVPYGSKSKKTVTRYSLDIAKFLESKNVKLILAACNTASALALDTLKKQIKTPLIGVIKAGAGRAAALSKNRKILILATQATVESKAYPRALKKLNAKIKTLQVACPLFVPVIENGFAKDEIAALAIKKYLTPVKKMSADTVILGCTHYPLIKKGISDFLGNKINLVDSSEEVAKSAEEILERRGLLNQRGRGRVEIYASDCPLLFAKAARVILGKTKLKIKERKSNL